MSHNGKYIIMTQVEPEKRNFWKKEEENLLKQWADKAQCYQWMHSRSHDIYSRKNALFTIPVIIISTITGTANFAQDRFNDDIKTYVVISIGTLSIIAGIITTVYQFLKIAELNEGHRVSTLSWGKFYRNIKTELTRHPLDRMPPLEMIKISRDEYDRLVELSPFMPMTVIKEFNSKFNKGKHIDLTKPEICDELASTVVFELNDEERKALMSSNSKKTPVNALEVKRKQVMKQQLNTKIDRFKDTFYSLNGRYPTQEEISKNMSKFTDDVIPEDVMRSIQSPLTPVSPVSLNQTTRGEATVLEIREPEVNTATNNVIETDLRVGISGITASSVAPDVEDENDENFSEVSHETIVINSAGDDPNGGDNGSTTI